MIPKTPTRVKRCITHHHACDCREWKYEQMESALKIIYFWARTELDTNKDLSQETIMNLCNIADTAHIAVHCLDEVWDEDDKY